MISPILIVIASLIGSPHCAGMCGGFSALVCQSKNPGTGQLLYHLGRLLTYVSLGALAGLFGSGVTLAGNKYGLHQLASIVSASILILWGLVALCGLKKTFQPQISFRILARLRELLLGKPKQVLGAAFILGVSSTLLPCGWLYTYVTLAAGTGSAFWGSAMMFFFWIGTLPLLITVGSISHFLTTPLKKYAPMLTSLLIVIAGTYSLINHFKVNLNEQAKCHEETS